MAGQDLRALGLNAGLRAAGVVFRLGGGGLYAAARSVACPVCGGGAAGDAALPEWPLVGQMVTVAPAITMVATAMTVSR
ncbi:MAG TPA: hypothetical protein VHY58_03945 [Streptosporangiaceae bacterium]|nr:hypothetical protein [Streptosporangiaceae bacterium]